METRRKRKVHLSRLSREERAPLRARLDVVRGPRGRRRTARRFEAVINEGGPEDPASDLPITWHLLRTRVTPR
jgi:hypothetical protein